MDGGDDNSGGGGGNPLWDFSLAVYARPGVAAACLGLQDRRGIDVNMLLLAAWAGRACGVALSRAELERIDSAIRPWREEVVRPLRAVRRCVKGEDAGLYDRMKAAELAAERIQQDRLFALAGLTVGQGGSTELARANLGLLLPDGDAEDRAAVEVVLGAV
ncbi:TIGR02444 family protein [Azospirillum sp. SYSU D00513]|uniref:TIGR02444 family protein n=1 Tax=Azospirillum sp. SYSU D00513 TaxID=2812561 RepID=UPI001A96CE8A